MPQDKVIVIGGGPAGMMAAATAALKGNEVILLERNEKLGKKLYITGKGRCNMTNASPIEDIFQNIPRNPKFLYSSIYGFTNKDLMELMDNLGLSTKIERGNRVFPVSDKSSDVIKALEKYLKQQGVNVIFRFRVKRILTKDNRVVAVEGEDGKIIECKSVILCTGGISYPSTGSTGDGYEMAKRLGHSIIEPTPSLIPLVISESWIKDLQGLALKNVCLSAEINHKIIYSEIGEMIFTHFGISGPLVLSLSSHIIDYPLSKVNIILDLKPGLSEEQLDKRIIRDFEKYARKQFKNALNDLLPQKIIPCVIQLSDIVEDKYVNQINKEERGRLVTLLKRMSIHVKELRPIEEAIITRGGINIKEINPSTMESKIVRGLFFAGEIIDVDAYTGGFNLQIAFSTGFAAGNSIYE